MTDIMKLADDYAEQRHTQGAPVYNAVSACARAALQSAIEALQKEVSTLDVLLEECKMDWSGDVTQLKSEHKHEIEALQAENERLKAERNQAADNVIVHIIECNRFEAERDALQAKLDAWKGNYQELSHLCQNTIFERDQLRIKVEGESVAVKLWCETCEGQGVVDNTLGGDNPNSTDHDPCPDCDGSGGFISTVYYTNAAPKALAPLTDEQKNSAWDDHWSNPSIPSTACSAFYAGMRFAEKHHGIGGTP